jgi:pimeloyl-ACP methyl ester carboxylesterase
VIIMPFVNVNGVKLNYLQIDTRSEAGGSELVMIHGLATSMGFWYFQHALSFSKAYRVTLFDLRGHGRSGMPAEGYSAENMSRDLERLLDHLEIAEAHFMAHSFGGAVALNLARRDQARFRSLILADCHVAAIRRQAGGRRWKQAEKVQKYLKARGLDLDVHDPDFGLKLLRLSAALHRNQIVIDKELMEVLQPAMGRLSKPTFLQWLRLLESTRAGQELMGDDGLSLDELRKLRFPILAVYGEHSPAMSTGEHLLGIWPHAEFHKMRNAGHFFPVTRVDEFAGRAWRFLRRSAAERLRRGEREGRRYFRTDRFYSPDGRKWFVDMREAAREGPFDSVTAAKTYLASKLTSIGNAGAGQGLQRVGPACEFSRHEN